MSLNDEIVHTQSKKYKKIFEKAVPFYPYKKGDETYVMVRYSRFAKVTGDLILKVNGNIVPRDTAAAIFQDYTAYDSCIIDCLNQIATDKEMPIKELKRMQYLLDAVVIPIADELSSSVIKQDINNACEMVNSQIKAKERFQEIFQEYKKIDFEVQGAQGRGYLIEKDVKKAVELNIEWEALNYNSLRKGKDALDSYPRLQAFCEEHRDAINNIYANAATELETLLKSFSRPDTVNTLRRSLEHFEENEMGEGRLNFATGNKGLEEYKDYYKRRAEYKFKKNIEPLLRNP